MKDGKRNGQGTLTWSDGKKYVGEWKDDKPWNGTQYDKSGNIDYKYVNGQKPVVKRKETGILFRDTPYSKWVEGGKKWFKSGDEKTQGKYEGEIVNGVPNGQGTLNVYDRGNYVGEFKDGNYHGHGTMILPDGRKYVGGFKDGKRHGQGTYTNPNGRKYVGEYKDGKKHGQGTETLPDGGKYEGEYKDGNPWNGINYDKDGNITTMYVNGVKQE